MALGIFRFKESKKSVHPVNLTGWTYFLGFLNRKRAKEDVQVIVLSLLNWESLMFDGQK